KVVGFGGARKLSPNISARRCKKWRARAWHLSASRTTRTSQTSGPISSSWGLMGRRNEANRQEGKKQESRWACRRSGSSHLNVGRLACSTLPEASADYLDPLTIVAGADGPNGAPATLSGRTTRTHPRTSFPP